MFDEAVSIVQNDPTKLPEGETEVTQENYFRIVSLNLLGAEQPVQFQSGSQYGTDSNGTIWHWGSNCSSVGDCTESGHGSSNNQYGQMPRAYVREDGSSHDYYNYYALTAEAGTFTDVVNNPQDSICPKGWKMPPVWGSKSWSMLITTGYGIANNTNPTPSALFQSPVSFVLSGTYSEYDGAITKYGSQGVMGSSTGGSGNWQYRGPTYLLGGTLIITAYPGKSAGASVRCVKK